jgi:hypothetical protein
MLIISYYLKETAINIVNGDFNLPSFRELAAMFWHSSIQALQLDITRLASFLCFGESLDI